MKRYTVMGDRFLTTLFMLLLLTLSGCIRKIVPEPNYDDPPRFVSKHKLTLGSSTLKPTRLQLIGDTLFVCYNQQAKIDLLNLQLETIRTITLTEPEPVYPTAFFVTDSNIFVTDHGKRALVVYDRDGNFETSFGALPNQNGHLLPFSLTFYGGVLYLSDMFTKSILAISWTDAEGITEKGELILEIPADSTVKIGFPSAVHVTFDGRLLVCDAVTGMINVFTCDGRHIYDFDSIQTSSPLAIQSFSFDDMLDPSMQDSTKFDPSGINLMGRVHAADPANGLIHMFNPVGVRITSYPASPILKKPSGIAINIRDHIIYVADPAAERIFLFEY